MKDIYDRLKSYEPLFGEYELAEFIGGGSFGWVYKVRQISRPSSFAALKVIPVPTSEYELHIWEDEYPQKDLLQKKIDQRMAKQIEEINALEMFEGNTHIVSYKLSSVKPYAGGLGYDILILMEYLQSLTQYLREHEIGEADVIQLGVDLCSALEIMRKKNVLHRDIKPQNIFYNELSGFKLGDFGISHSSMQEFFSSTAGTKVYAAPEIIKAEKIEAGDNSSDIYSLGLIMYQLLNDNKLPFVTDDCNPDEAFQKRLSNEPFPHIENVNGKLLSIINKACAFNRFDRFNNEMEMRKELEILQDNNILNVNKTELPAAENGGNQETGKSRSVFYRIRTILWTLGICAGLVAVFFFVIRANPFSVTYVNNPGSSNSPPDVSETTAVQPSPTQIVTSEPIYYPSVTNRPTENTPTENTHALYTPTDTPAPAAPSTAPTQSASDNTSTPTVNIPKPKLPTHTPTQKPPARIPTPSPKPPSRTPTPTATQSVVTITPTVTDNPSTTTNTSTSGISITDTPVQITPDSSLTPTVTDTPEPAAPDDTPVLLPEGSPAPTDIPTATEIPGNSPTPAAVTLVTPVNSYITATPVDSGTVTPGESAAASTPVNSNTPAAPVNTPIPVSPAPTFTTSSTASVTT